MPIRLSERQEKTVANAITVLAGAVVLLAVAAVLWMVGNFLREFSGVFLPLAVAGVAALVFKPYYEWLRDVARLPAAIAVAAVFLSAIVPLVAFFWFFGAVTFEQIGDLVHKAPELWARASESIQERWPRMRTFFEEHPIGVRIREAVESSSEQMMAGLQNVGLKAMAWTAIVFRFLGNLLSWAVSPIYFAFFLMVEPERFGGMARQVPFLKPGTRDDLFYLVREFVNIIVAFFRGQLIVAMLQGLLFAVGFSVVGLRYGFILGLMLGFLNIIPYLGSIVGLAIALPLGFFQEDGGGIMLVLWVMVVFTVVQMIEAYVLTPKVMGDRTGLHPMAIIVAVFFWGTALNGLMGMVLAIPLTAFLVVFWRLAREKYMTAELV